LARPEEEAIVNKSTRKSGKAMSPNRSGSRKSVAQTGSANRRRVVVFLSLLAVLSLTSLLLNTLAKSPMHPDAADTLFAYGTGDTIDSIFHMQVPVQATRWQFLYIHHSKTTSGSALQLSGGPEGVGDHFIIGNGDGLIDGELQISQRWNHQQAAGSPAGTLKVQPNCVSICLVGDFDRHPPTPMQLGRLGQLVQAMQLRFRIPANRVQWLNDGSGPTSASAAGIGKYFPASAFHDQLRSWPAMSLTD
jgi:hypothetical protein